ncbi:MAG: hypothetical protein IJ055_03285 [Oscillospiraceae bacterium]|nr:hypothetical protein [Oscillospiraceae bacterium]
MLPAAIENSVATGDSSHILLWIILAGIALALLVVSAVLSVKNKKDDGDKH